MFCPGFFHDTLGENGPGGRGRQGARLHPRPLRRAARPRRRCSTPTGSATRATRPTRLASPLPPLSPRGLYWAHDARQYAARRARCPRASRSAIAPASTSGSTLDYVYRNQPRGRRSARPADRPQLSRTRSAGAASASASCMSRSCSRDGDGARCADKGMPVRIVDIAAGHGRYVLEALDEQRRQRRSRSCCATTATSTSQPERQLIAAARACADIARFVKGDAFDRDSLAAIEPPPTLGVVSGLYELFRRQRDGAPLARRAGRRDPAGGYLDLHRPALASAARADRPRADQPSRRAGLDHAPAHAGRDGPARRGGRVSQDRAAHRRMGHLHRVARRAGQARLSRAAADAADRGRTGGAAVAPRHRLALPARPVLLRHLRRGELARGAARRCRRRSSSPGNARSRSSPGRSCRTGRSTSSTACRCSSAPRKAELDTHARRLLTAQVVAVACFILFPLRFTFVQPEAPTASRASVRGARPASTSRSTRRRRCTSRCSCILWVLYARHVPRWALWPLQLWFALLGVSVLTTYQHHFIDIPTGALLGFLCLWLWPDSGAEPAGVSLADADERRRLVLAVRYAVAAAALASPRRRSGRRRRCGCCGRRSRWRWSPPITRSSAPADSRRDPTGG